MGRPTAVVIGVVAVLGLGVAGILVFDGGFVFDGGTGDEPDSTDGVVYSTVQYDVERDPDVPDLPFDDNPDPAQCGIPVQLGEGVEGWLTGTWEGALIQPEVLVYDSHLRVSITGRAAHGTKVEIVLFQENPVLDYYFVKIPGPVPQEGWVPEPFLSFDPVA